jgi:cysteine sulfinate desulfinase/cysteine desulfurase-like protein
MISAGSAGSSGSAKESLIMLQLGLQKFAKNGLRLSLPLDFSETQLNSIKERFYQVFEKFKSDV